MDFELLNHPHPHPLIFIDEGKRDEEVDYCSRCNKALNPPAFSCSVCNFHLHQSCIQLPPVIQTHFHPKHALALTKNSNHCSCCRRMPLGHSYFCSQCNFQIDIKCALADTKQSGLQRKSVSEFQHFSHPHPLILILQQAENIRKEVVCSVCELLITSGGGSTYFCSRCDSHFHKDCAELPREIHNPDYHHHPLILFSQPFMRDNFCDNCKNECTEFIYCCPECNFNLHISCLSSFNHEHTFTKLRNQFEFVCQACGKKENGFPWFCTICHLLVHKKCAELPSTLKTAGHRLHDLSLEFFRRDVSDKIFCKICNEGIKTRYAGYSCHQCNYFAHLDCARWQRIDPHLTPIDAPDSPTDPINNDENLENGEIPHFSHKHNLIFSQEELELDRHCDGCMQRLSSPSYGCAQCDFFLHKGCAQLPRRKTHFLHEHPLALISIPDFAFQCNACLEYFHGFAYHCKICPYTLDIRCASIELPFIHSSHEHPLSLNRTNEERNCDACGQKAKNKTVFRCADCNFYLESRCATLPVAVRYRFDRHPLKLTFIDEDEVREYYCDICEEERDTYKWFYSCGICCFAAHPGCALGEFPYLKSGMYEGHSHPLTLAMELKTNKSSPTCGACGNSCAKNLAFACGRCKFSVHAIGPCHQRQLIQGRLSFAKHCLDSRAIGLRLQHPIQERPRIRLTLGGYGGTGGNPWDEKVFSTIKGFVIYHGQWIDSIKIQYDDKDGKSVWSDKHGGNGGSRTEVALEYPKEHLISIGGYYSDVYKRGAEASLVRSLTLVTNRRSYGPFGVEEGTKFSFRTTGVKIVGIHGRSGAYLDSIGLHAVSI